VLEFLKASPSLHKDKAEFAQQFIEKMMEPAEEEEVVESEVVEMLRKQRPKERQKPAESTEGEGESTKRKEKTKEKYSVRQQKMAEIDHLEAEQVSLAAAVKKK